MFFRYCFALLILILIPAISIAQPVKVKLIGHIIASDTHETIPGASLAILGTTRGARSNKLGSYSLELDAEQEYRIRISSLGYKTDTIRIKLSKSETRDFTLKVSPLQASEITVSADASRKEARRIMHKAIDEKMKWQPEIKNYTCDVYSRINVQKIESGDTILLSIFETYSNGYYDKEKGQASHIIARKQTANVPADLNQISLLGISSFYNDRIDIDPYSIVSPLGSDAFDRYDYDLLGTRQIGGSNAYEISVEPRGVIAPALEGKIWIDQTDYSLVYVQVHPNGALKFPLVTQADVEQSYTQVNNKYGFPAETHLIIGAAFQIPFTPSFSAELTGLMQNYSVNTSIPDSIFGTKRIVIDSLADKVDSNNWSSMRGVALTPQESKAYTHIDSVVKTEAPKEAPSPFSFSYSLFPLVYYDRVESFNLRASVSFGLSEVVPFTSNLAGGYAFGDKKFRYTGSITAPIIWHYQNQKSTSVTMTSDGDVLLDQHKSREDILSARFSLFDDIARIGNAYEPLANSIFALLFRRDYPNYYNIHGGSIGLIYPITKDISIDVNYINRDERSLKNATEKVLFFKPDTTLRINPPINDGTFRAISIAANASFDLGAISLAPAITLVTTGKSLSSSFEYEAFTLENEFTLRIPGLGPTSLQLGYETKVSGAMPNQHLFSFESRNVFLAERYVFHTMSDHEYQGDASYCAMFEQNFYDLPTRLIGLNLKPIDLHWIGFLNVGATTLSSESAALLKSPIKTTNGSPFVEAGFGIGNILNLLRIDAAWRVTHRIAGENFAITATLGISF